MFIMYKNAKDSGGNGMNEVEKMYENAWVKEKLRFDCLKCIYKNTKADADKYKQALAEIKEIAEEISYLGSRGERKIKFKIKNILEKVLNEEIY